MIKTYVTRPGERPTPEQIKEMQEAAKLPITFDDDCPELSLAMQKAFRSAVVQRSRRREA